MVMPEHVNVAADRAIEATQPARLDLLVGYTLEEARRVLGAQYVSMAFLKTFDLTGDELDHRELLKDHKKDHSGRMVVLSPPLLFALKQEGLGISGDDVEAMFLFSGLHDAFLTKDNYPNHGYEAAGYVLHPTRSRVPERLRTKVAQLIRHHVPYDPPEGLPFLSKVAKDLDALDRARLPDGHHLDPSYLRFRASLRLIRLAEELYNQSQIFMIAGEEPFYAALHAGKELGILGD